MRFTLTKDLAPHKAKAEAIVDRLAGECRSRYITVSPGQEMVYARKEREAEMILANPQISPSTVPHLALEADAAGITLTELATVVQAKANEWLNLSPPIESTRLTTKAAIRAATTPAEIEALIAQARSIFEQTA